MSYFRNLPRVYLLDIETGVQEVVGDFPGMTFAPRFSPDGKKIIMSFAKDGKLIEDIGAEISKVIETNFRRSRLFNPLKKESFVKNPDIAHIKPRFEDWRLIKAQALVTGKVTVSEDKLRAEFRLWDVVAAKEMIALAFSTTPNNWRRVAHIISDKVYQRLTGEEGYFDTRIIYVA